MSILKKRFKPLLEDIVFENTVFKSRYNDGAADLKKGLGKGLPITNDQKDEILAFWDPFLNTRLTRKAFDIRWFDIYNRINVFKFDLKQYIPDSFYYCIVDPFFSDFRAAQAVDDKNLYDLLCGDVRQPRTICRKIGDLFLNERYNVITEEAAIKKCLDEEAFIIKPSVGTCSGSGIRKYKGVDVDFESLRKSFHDYKSFVIQEYVKQHCSLSRFNDTCVNTLRLVSLVLDREVIVTASVVIMGGKNAVTNHLHRGGLVCGIKDDGSLRETAFDGKLNQYSVHPGGVVFSESSIPGYHACVDTVKKLAPRFCQVSRLIGWDFTIGVDGSPVLIETNLSWGGLVQIASGPVFGDLTPEVLTYMRNQGMRRMTR